MGVFHEGCCEETLMKYDVNDDIMMSFSIECQLSKARR